MKNKVLIELVVPELDRNFMLFIPINKKIGNIIVLLNKSITELSNGLYIGDSKTALYNKESGEKYSINELVRNTNIRNGTVLILM